MQYNLLAAVLAMASIAQAIPTLTVRQIPPVDDGPIRETKCGSPNGRGAEPQQIGVQLDRINDGFDYSAPPGSRSTIQCGNTPGIGGVTVRLIWANEGSETSTFGGADLKKRFARIARECSNPRDATGEVVFEDNQRFIFENVDSC